MSESYNINLMQGNITPWTFTIKNSLGNAVNISSYTFILTVSEDNTFNDLDSEILQLGGIITDAANGKVSFSLSSINGNLASGNYYYKLDVTDSEFNKQTLYDGQFNVYLGNRGVSALDWKPNAVSGQLGNLFGAFSGNYYNNTSGLSFYSINKLYKNNTSSIVLGFSHAEEGYWNDPTTGKSGYRSELRLQVSLDNGSTFYDAGPIAFSKIDAVPSGPIYKDTIQATPLVFEKDGYLNVYYFQDRVASAGTTSDYTTLALLQAPTSSVLYGALNKTVSGPWKKYYQGAFTENNLSGESSNLLKYFVPSTTYMDGVYVSNLENYVMLLNTDNRLIDDDLYSPRQMSRDIFAIYSDDSKNFSQPQRLTISPSGFDYFSVVSDQNEKGRSDGSFYLYLASGIENNSWSSVNVLRLLVSSVSPTESTPSLLYSTYTNAFDRGKTLDRGQLHPYMATLHYIMEQAKIQEASAYYYQNPSALIAESRWKNVLQSYANSSTELSGNYPDSFDDYLNYELGRDIHKFYNYYTKYFNRHKTSPLIMDMDGPIITSHALGSLIYNSKFDKRGSLTASNPNFITTNLSSVYDFRVGSGVFSSSGTSSGTYIASSILNYGSSINEYRNSGILDHIELCQTSGSSPNNLFSIIDINYSGKPLSTRNKLLNDNVLIRQVSNNGFGRIIFDISKYTINNSLYGVSNNFLLPEHQFEFSIKSLISDFDGLRIGDGNIGVWIHTKPESNYVWSYAPSVGWIEHSASGITKQDVLAKYSHIFSLPKLIREKPGEDPSKFVCLNYLNKDNPNRTNDVMASFLEENFSELKIKFNTLNKSCNFRLIPSKDYAEQISTDVHRLNQNYVVEVFTVPNPINKNFTLFYDVNMVDLTLNKMSKPFVTGIPNGSHFGEIYSKEFRVDLSKEHILNIIKYFNQITGAYQSSKVDNFKGYASRVASSTSGIYEVSGGSRINYVEDPNWGGVNLNTKNLNEIISIIN